MQLEVLQCNSRRSPVAVRNHNEKDTFAPALVCGRIGRRMGLLRDCLSPGGTYQLGIPAHGSAMLVCHRLSLLLKVDCRTGIGA